MNVEIDRKCNKCGAKVKQYVGYVEKDGRITIEVWKDKCPVCMGFLEKPSPGEVRRALLNKLRK